MHVAYLISKKYINIHWFLLICITLRGSSELLPIPADLGGSAISLYFMLSEFSFQKTLSIGPPVAAFHFYGLAFLAFFGLSLPPLH